MVLAFTLLCLSGAVVLAVLGYLVFLAWRRLLETDDVTAQKLRAGLYLAVFSAVFLVAAFGFYRLVVMSWPLVIQSH